MVEALPTAPPFPDPFADFKPPPARQAIQKIRYSHDAMIDMIVGNPWISQGELARNFDYTEGWVSQVIASDAFQSRLEERKNELIDPRIRATIEERFKGLVVRSIEILMRKLDQPLTMIDDATALKALEVASKAAGYGARVGVQLNQQFVVQVPSKAASSAEWEQAHGQGPSAHPSEHGGRALDSAVLLAELKGV